MIAFVLANASCCKFFYGEDLIGNRFAVVEESKESRTINYCTSTVCCSSSFVLIPQHVESFDYDEKWIIAKSVQTNGEQFWIINKINEIDLSNCDKNDCVTKVKNNVIGPLFNSVFNTKLKELNIDLAF